MKVYVITRLEKSQKGGAFLKKTKVFISKIEAIKWIRKDIEFEKEILENKFEEYIKNVEVGFFQYIYENETLGNVRVEYDIWEEEL